MIWYTSRMNFSAWFAVSLIFTLAPQPISRGAPEGTALSLFDDFRPGWKRHWMEREMSDRSTSYEVIEAEGELVLRARSAGAASALWRALSFHPTERGTLSWRWKVEKSLTGNDKERTKSGDDYAARLMIIFDPELFTLKTQAICYVWAAEEPVGSVYSNPYAANVATIVLRSGDERSGRWVSENRNFVRDFRQVFGRSPEMVTAIAIIVDTDNTGTRATAWFDDLQVDQLE